MKGQMFEPLQRLYSLCVKATRTLLLTREVLKSPSVTLSQWTLSIQPSPHFLAFYSLLPIQAMHSQLSGYPESFCSDCPWMVPVASWSVMAASLWDKQPLRKGGRTITNQCVRLPDDTQRSGAEAASHFTPEAFWSGCLMDRLRLTTKCYQLLMEIKG